MEETVKYYSEMLIDDCIRDSRLLIFKDDTISLERSPSLYYYLTFTSPISQIGKFTNHYHIIEKTLGPLNITHGIHVNHSWPQDLGIGWELKANYQSGGGVYADNVFILTGGKHPLMVTRVWSVYSQYYDLPPLRKRINELFSEDWRVWRKLFERSNYGEIEPQTS